MVVSAINKTQIRVLGLPRTWFGIFILVCSDLLALVLSASIVFEVSRRLGLVINLLFDPYRQMQPALLLFVLVYFLVGLYPGFGFGAVEELRRLSYSTALTYLILASSTFFIRGGEEFSRGIFLALLGLSLVLVPLFRAGTRELFARRSWWGVPVVILGAAQTGQLIVQQLQRLPNLGLKPIAVFDDDVHKHGFDVSGVPVVGSLQDVPSFQKLGVRWALVAMPGVGRERMNEILKLYVPGFPHVVVFPDAFGMASLWVSARDFSGVLGLEIRQQLLMPLPKIVKRVLDLLIVIPVTVLCLPILLIVTLLIQLESPGAAIFFQERPGLGGKRFKIAKFRSMFKDAEARFSHLPAEQLEEFKQFGKIKSDPRITNVGEFIRKTSIDELPQLWNVLRGEMSLVGPRAYLLNQMSQVGSAQDTILQVLPGVTGLWQVSGRSELSFDERLSLDMYYVRNWSPWLDVYILARTAWVVLFAKGAY
jgi:Undecaprenyl-phosphate galactose phosphotransferase WbaP